MSSYIWKYTDYGNYSVKSEFQVACNRCNGVVSTSRIQGSFWKNLWNISHASQPKCIRTSKIFCQLKEEKLERWMYELYALFVVERRRQLNMLCSLAMNQVVYARFGSVLAIGARYLNRTSFAKWFSRGRMESTL